MIQLKPIAKAVNELYISSNNNISIINTALKKKLINAEEYHTITGVYYVEPVPTLDELKSQRIKESNEALQEWYKTHKMTSSARGGTPAEYSVSADKQAYFSSELGTNVILSQYQPILDALNLKCIFSWNASGEPCEPWDDTEKIQLAAEMYIFVKRRVSEQQYWESIIMKCNSKEEVDNVGPWDYDNCTHGAIDEYGNYKNMGAETNPEDDEVLENPDNP